MRAKPRAASPIGALAVLLAAAGCGGATKPDRVPEAREKGLPLPVEERLVERRLVTDRDVRKASAESAERAFLLYWSAISYEDWRGAVQYIDTSVRRALDPSTLVAALRQEGQNNLPVKPIVRDVREVRGATTVRYFVRRPTGELRPTSSAWRRRDGSWYMVYSATLDDSYSSAAQQAVQSEVDPGAAAPSSRALRAASRALRAQARALRP